MIFCCNYREQTVMGPLKTPFFISKLTHRICQGPWSWLVHTYMWSWSFLPYITYIFFPSLLAHQRGGSRFLWNVIPEHLI